MKTGTVSVVMPTYNHARYIRQAIASVLVQTYRELELIVVDNHSTDGTGECVRGFDDDRIRYFTFRNNGVIAASRNFGATQTGGEFIAFLDSDDMWADDKLTRQLDGLSGADIALIGSAAWLLDEDQIRGRTFVGVSRRGFRDYSYEDLVQNNAVHTSSALMRRAAFQRAGGFDECPELVCVEDYDLWLRVARTGRVRVLGKPLISYRIHPATGRNKIAEAERALGVIEKQFRLGHLRDERARNNACGTVFRGMARIALEADLSRSRRYYLKALSLSTKPGERLKAAVGYAASYLPLAPRLSLDFLAWGRASAYQGVEYLRNIADRIFKAPIRKTTL